MIKKYNNCVDHFIRNNNRKKKRENKIGIVLFITSLLVITSISISGCVSEDSTKSADVILTNMTHAETLQLPLRYISIVTFSLQNIGDAPAKNITMRVIAYDTEGNEQYYNNESVVSVLDPAGMIPHQITIFYILGGESVNLNLTIRWNTGEHTYTRSFTSENIKYANVQLDYLTHHEQLEFPDIHISHVNFTVRNTGNTIAEDVKAYIIVYDQDNNELFNQDVNVTALLRPEEFTNYSFDIFYDLEDNLLGLNITVKWDAGENNYTQSFSPEFIEKVDVQLENMTHFERYRLFVGHTSNIDFIFQNRGNEPAKNVALEVVAKDQDGNINYDQESNVIGMLILPGAIVTHEISIPYDFDDVLLNLTITVKWIGGENHYIRSFTPKLGI